jgi:hypothetical protein
LPEESENATFTAKFILIAHLSTRLRR